MTPIPPRARNPIERRLELLGAAWNEFSMQPEPRLLRWIVPAEDVRMLEVFFEYQSEPGSRIPDVFHIFHEPFQAPKKHGFTLLDAFRASFEEARPELSALGLEAAWACPEPLAKDSDVQALARACASFQKHHSGLVSQLVLVLWPEKVTEAGAWRDWLRTLLQAAPPEGVRFTVPDLAEKPALAELDKLEPKLVRSFAPGIDLPAAMRECAKGAGKSTPGDRFRCLMLEAMQLAGKSDLPKMEAKAAGAMKIALQQGWKDLQVIVHLLLGATQLGKAHGSEAIAAYQDAGKAAMQAREAGVPTGSKLLLQSRFGEGAALLSIPRHADAAKLYEETAPLAQEAGEAYFTMEAWRMAGYCHQQAKQAEPAWRCYWKALEAAQTLDEPTRRTSTVPYAGQGLLELARSNPYKKEADSVRERMTELAGPDWEAQLKASGGRK